MVGGGAVARRKILGLLECGALVTVVSPELMPGLKQAADLGDFCYNRRGFQAEDLDGKCLAIAATGNHDLNLCIARICRYRKIPVNVVDNPELSTFFVPSVVRRGPLCISISTGGNSPLLARRIREDLDEQLRPGYEEIAEMLGEMRRRIQDRLPDEADRQGCWENIVTRELISLLKAGETEKARRRVEAACTLLLSE